jgi:HEAT repeats
VSGMMVATPSTRAWRGAFRQLLSQLPRLEPQFTFRVLWTSDYEGLLSDQFDTSGDVLSLVREAKRKGRVILHAGAGAGKSSILLQVLREAAPDSYPVFLDLARLRPDAIQETESVSQRLHVLLRGIARPSIDEATLAALPGGRLRLLLVDGLSEVAGGTADVILSTLEAFARRNPNAGFVVADRLTRRAVPDDAWGLASVAPLDDAQIRVHAREVTPLLKSPLFLDLAIKKGIETTTESDTFRRYFVDTVGLTREQLRDAGHAAFLAYLDRPSRTFVLSVFQTTAGNDATDLLVRTGTLRKSRDPDSAFFQHHLFHDYLASVWFAKHPEQWDPASLNAVTFKAASFDVLALTLEQITVRDKAEDFLRHVYDWNFYGSGYALAKVSARQQIAVSPDMETALLAMLASRRWDAIEATALRVTDALRLFDSESATEYLRADEEQVYALVRDHDFESQEFREWRNLFLVAPATSVEDSVVDSIEDEDSLIGWTAANVLKRVHLSESQEALLRDLLGSKNKTIRWRVAHALGAHPSNENVNRLTEVLDDPDEWVRYGAIRSLVEAAARSSSLRDGIISEIRKRIPDIVRMATLSWGLEHSLVLRQPPDQWPDAVAPLVEELWARAPTIEEQDRWRKAAHRILTASGQVPV